MSEEEYEYGSEEDYNYGSHDEEEEGQEDLAVIENAFYEGEELRGSNPKKALEMFAKVVELETQKGGEVTYRFKALKNMVTLHHSLGQFQDMVASYKEMLKYVANVTRNQCTDSINSILDTVNNCTDLGIVSQMYEVTLDALKTAGNERMCFTINAKLAKAYMQGGNHQGGKRITDELHKSCQLPDGTDDMTKGSCLLEVYGLHVQYCSVVGDVQHLRSIYPKITNLQAAVEDPRTMGFVREEGGKMYMGMEQWGAAYNEFYEGFRNYQEAGNKRAKDCLKYVVLANMLALSDINPFAAREAKVYQDEKEVAAMMQLRLAYEKNDLSHFEKTLRNKQNRILDDPFIMLYIDPLKHRMREQVLLALVRPYDRCTIKFMAKELNLQPEAVEGLLVALILDKRLHGRIDQINGYVELGGSKMTASSKKYESLENWTDALAELTKVTIDHFS